MALIGLKLECRWIGTPWHRTIRPMQLIEIDIIRLQTAQAVFNRFAHLGRCLLDIGAIFAEPVHCAASGYF